MGPRQRGSEMAQKSTRQSCGYCDPHSPRRHKKCPETLPYARAGKPWTCWCAENGHPAVVPPAPKVEVIEDEPTAQTEEAEQPKAEAPEPKAPRAKGSRELAPRCGVPTSKGPCKRKEGHTTGHDAR